VNPFYGRPGIASRVDAFKELIRMCRRWGEAPKWGVFIDTVDHDYHVFSRGMEGSERYVKIASGGYTEKGWPSVRVILHSRKDGEG